MHKIKLKIKVIFSNTFPGLAFNNLIRLLFQQFRECNKMGRYVTIQLIANTPGNTNRSPMKYYSQDSHKSDSFPINIQLLRTIYRR